MIALLRRICVAVLVIFTGTVLAAQQHCPDVGEASIEGPLVIGTKFAPPLVMGPKDAPEGLAIDLWTLLAECHGLTPDAYSFREFGTSEDLINAAASGAVDIALSALPITVQDEARIDFTVPFLTSGIGTMVPDRPRAANFTLLLTRILHSNVLTIVFSLMGFLLAVALIYWLIERRSGNKEFTGAPFAGFFRAMIWSALLLFQGQGDPFELKSRFGQLFVLLLMIVGVTVISSFTAIITSSLTLQALEPEIIDVEDLNNQTVAVIAQGDADNWASDQRLTVQSLQSFSQVQLQIDEGEIDAFLHDSEVLHYLILRQNLTGVKMAPLEVAPRQYAIVLPHGSPAREAVNLGVLTIRDSLIWETIKGAYFGGDL